MTGTELFKYYFESVQSTMYWGTTDSCSQRPRTLLSSVRGIFGGCSGLEPDIYLENNFMAFFK
jgi:hypothetical protein